MRLNSIFFILFIAFTSIAMRANNLPIPVHVNESITITLFFPSEIKRVIEPAPHYKFVYEPNGRMATLVARKGAASNLTVITKDGSIYSFLLQYDTEVNNFTYMLAEDQAIGKMNGSSVVAVSAKNIELNTHDENADDQKLIAKTEPDASENPFLKENGSTKKKEKASLKASNPTVEETPEIAGSSLYNSDREGYYQIFCENSYKQKTRFKKSSNTINLIGLHLNNIIKDHNDLHFVLEVKNDSWTDYKVKSLKFFIKSPDGNHEIEIEELFIYNLQESIAAHNGNHLVFVCKDFALGKGQNIYVLLEEEEGRERSVMLSLSAEQINRSR
ncbi:hypothetical protein [Zobellia laminariae]|uniref:hypothetical protein n=2 Tax=Zobellia laminariae TaxID=248906 RepID=UPI0026F4146A|nr:hypothetical protein [Zobellia laminariae]WKX76216.1 hypothetical protein Q5W13_22040 [Zobellia laminariae]